MTTFGFGRRSVVGAAAVTLLAGGAFVGGTASVSAADKTSTSTMIMSTMRTGAKQPILGMLTPDRAGSPVTVKYFKKVDGRWVRKATKTATVGAGDVPGEDFFFVQFRGVTGGKCKVVAKYAGDASYAASSAKRVFGCRDGM